MPNRVRSQLFTFSQGLADQVNDDVVVNGYALKLQDAVFDKLSRVVKRGGHTALAPRGAVDLLSSSTWRLGSHSGAPLLFSSMTSRNYLKQYLSDSNSLAGSTSGFEDSTDFALHTGMKCNVRPRRWTVAGDLTDAKNGHCAYVGNVMMTAFESTGVVHWSIQEVDTGATLFSSSAVGTAAKCVAVDGYLVVFFINFAGDLLAQATNTASLSTGLTTSENFGPVGGAGLYDVHAYSSTQVAIAFQDSAAPTTTVQLRLWGVLSGATHSTSVAISATSAMSWVNDRIGTGRRALAYAGANGTGCIIRTSTLGASASLTLDATATSNVRNITGIHTDAVNSDRVCVLWEEGAASSINHKVKLCRYFGGATVTTLVRGCGLRSKIFFVQNANSGVYIGEPFFIVSYDSDVQPTYFLMWLNTDNTVTVQQQAPQAKFLGLAAGGHTETTNSLCMPADISGTNQKFAWVATKRARIESQGATLIVEKHIEAFSLDFAGTELGSPKQVGPWTLSPGGNLRAFDGGVLREWLFDLRPEAPTVTSSGGAPGALTPGDVRSYRIVYSITDAAGMVHRSAPSVQVSGTVAVGHSVLSLSIPTLRITSQMATNAAFQGVTIEVYATEAGQGAAGLLFQLIRQEPNIPTADTTTVVDGASNAAQNSGTVLYCGDSSTGSELENLAPPGLLDLAAWKGRIVGISAEKPTEIWISKSITINTAPGFSESLVMDAPEPMTALSVIDDQLFVFSASAAYRVTEEPPDDTGAGSMPRLQRVGDAGTTYPRMVVSYEGIWFHSGDRLLRISRGAQVEYGIGDPAENVVSVGTPVCAVAIPERAQVRWYYRDGTYVIYDTKRNVWSTCALPASLLTVISAINFEGNALLACEQGGYTVLWKESDSVYTDPSSALTPLVSPTAFVPQVMPAFLSADSKLGQIRIHEVQPMGELLGACILQVAAHYDFNRITPTELATKTLSTVVNARYKPRKRRCESFSARWLEYPQGGVAGAGVALTGVLILYSIENNKAHRGNATAMF